IAVALRNTTLSWQRAFLVGGSLVLVVAAIYFARPVLIPLVLAILLAFVLNPLVCILQRRGLPRILSVTLVVLMALAVVAGLGYAVISQVRSLALDLPHHKDEIIAKLAHIREASKDSWIDHVSGTIQEIEEAVRQTWQVESTSAVVRVRVESSTFPLV